MERFKLLQPNKTRIVGKGGENERILDYRPTQQEQRNREDQYPDLQSIF